MELCFFISILITEAFACPAVLAIGRDSSSSYFLCHLMETENLLQVLPVYTVTL